MADRLVAWLYDSHFDAGALPSPVWPARPNRRRREQVDSLRESTWPDNEVPQQLHLDLTVPSMEELESQHERAMELGARLLEDRSRDEEEPLRVYADPDGHPFCIFLAPS